MSKKLPSKIERIDTNFRDELRRIMDYRARMGLANIKPEELSIAEATRLLTRTQNWEKVKQELKIKPKKRNGK